MVLRCEMRWTRLPFDWKVLTKERRLVDRIRIHAIKQQFKAFIRDWPRTGKDSNFKKDARPTRTIVLAIH